MIRFGFPMNIEPDRKSRDPYGQMFEICVRAEELGFDFVKLPHHRFTEHYPSSPFVLLAGLAARTTSLRLATGILILPTLHPLEVAEHVCQLDELSGGRAILGVGVGYREHEFAAVGSSYAARGDRMSESLEVLERVLTETAVSYRGRHFQFDDVTLQPRPMQPRLPVWVGAQKRVGVERAGRLADGWMTDFQQTLSALTPKVECYRAAAAAAGRPSTVCLLRHVAIAATREEVERDWLPGALEVYRHYWEAGARWREDEGLHTKLERGQTVTLPEFASGRAIAGTPDDCIAEIQRYIEATGCEYLHVDIRQPGIRTDAQRLTQQLELFAREVIPAFAK